MQRFLENLEITRSDFKEAQFQKFQPLFCMSERSLLKIPLYNVGDLGETQFRKIFLGCVSSSYLLVCKHTNIVRCPLKFTTLSYCLPPEIFSYETPRAQHSFVDDAVAHLFTAVCDKTVQRQSQG